MIYWSAISVFQKKTKIWHLKKNNVYDFCITLLQQFLASGINYLMTTWIVRRIFTPSFPCCRIPWDCKLEKKSRRHDLSYFYLKKISGHWSFWKQKEGSNAQKMKWRSILNFEVIFDLWNFHELCSNLMKKIFWELFTNSWRIIRSKIIF